MIQKNLLLKKSPILVWTVPTALVLLGLLGQFILSKITDGRPLIFLYPAIAIGCFFGNKRSTIMATLIGAVTARFFFYDDALNTQMYLSLSMFVFSGIFISVLSDLVIKQMEKEIHLKEHAQAKDEIGELLESMSDAFFAVDKDWKVIRVNARHEELMGLKRSDQLGRHLLDLFFNSDSLNKDSVYWKSYHKVMADRVPVQFEDYYEPLNLWAEVRVYPQKDGGFAAFFTDIGERKQHEMSLAIERQKLHVLVTEASSAIGLMRGPDLVFEIANKKWTELVSPREYIGRSYADVYPELVGTEAHQSHVDIFRTGEPFIAHEMKLLVTSPAGILEDQYYDFANIRIMDADGKPYGVYCNALNVTERVLARSKLQLSEERLRLSLTSGNIGFWDWNAATNYTYLSDTLMSEWGIDPRTFNHTLEEAMARIHVDDRERVWAEVQKATFEKRAYDVEYRVVKPAGEIIWINAKGEFVVNADAKPERLTGVTINMTAQKMAAEELNRARLEAEQAKVEAEKANELKSAFLANMSHEIRTPLGAMIGFADLLRDPDLTKVEHANYLDVLSRNGEQLSYIINDILDLSKVEAGHLVLEYLPTSPAKVMAEVISLLSVKSKEKDLALEYIPSPSTPEKLVTDSSRVRQVLINLVSNAIKFTQFGKVTVTSSSAKTKDGRTELIFDVIDTGIGLAKDQTEPIFEMFVQADGSITRKFGGTGLGLSLSRKLARELGGDVSVIATAPGKGSTFRFSIVDRPEKSHAFTERELHAQAQKSAATEFNEQTLQEKKVLVVDDSPDNQQLLWHYLTKMGAAVEVADDGLEGFRKALAGNYDIVLMDIQMPLMDGYTATHRLRENGYKKPIIALTAHAMTEVRRKCLNVGCTDHLPKPINPKDLIRAILSYT